MRIDATRGAKPRRAVHRVIGLFLRRCASWTRVRGRLLLFLPSGPDGVIEETNRDGTAQALGHRMTQGGEEFLNVEHRVAILDNHHHPRSPQGEVQGPTETTDAVAN
jgi:hypothetical protein